MLLVIDSFPRRESSTLSPEGRAIRLSLTAMIHSIQQMREASPAFRQALLKSEKKRIVGVIAFVSFFAVLAGVRIFVLGSAMSRWSLVAVAVMIVFEVGLFRAVNQSLQSGKDIPSSTWYVSSVVECLFPAIGVAFLVSTRLLADYRPLATPWALAFFPFILLSVLRLTPKLCWVCGIVSTVGYLSAAYLAGWHFIPGPDGFTVTQTAVCISRLCFSSRAVGRRGSGRNPRACRSRTSRS